MRENETREVDEPDTSALAEHPLAKEEPRGNREKASAWAVEHPTT